MNILTLWKGAHDDSITLISDSNVFAIELERLSRVKHNCDQDMLTQVYLNNQLGDLPEKKGFSEILNRTVKYLLEAANQSIDKIDIVSGIKIKDKNQYESNFTHHENHAASAYFPSGYENAAILVVDVFGTINEENLCETVSFWKGTNNTLSHIKTYYSPPYQFKESVSQKYNYHNSIGVFYMDCTILCGFKVLEAGKTMGLSAYGTSRYCDDIQKYIEFDKLTCEVKFYRSYIDFFENEKKKRKDSFEYKADVAYATQKILEDLIIAYCNHLYLITNCKSICLSGGIALNSVANGLITKRTPFENIFIQPAAKDSSQSLGKALNIYYQFPENYSKPLNYNSFYLGKEYDIDKFMENNDLFENLNVISKSLNLYEFVAKELSEGKIIGWFQGRSEFGPRALGNRSILCAPNIKDMKDILNKRVKFREWFRPFAPIVMEEFLHEYFEIEKTSPYMLLVGKVKVDTIPAVTHVDGSARLQSVNINQNKRIYLLIKEFCNITGIPVLLNTSFNIKGQPIIESPKDALDTFINSNIDILVLGDFLITKKQLKQQ